MIAVLGVVCLAAAANAATTINPINHYAYGANIGWVEARGDVSNGAVIGEFACSGSLWGANVGWISLGNGSPTNGVRYRNLATNDFGVNHDGAGNLSGLAYGANLGWINFTNRDATGATFQGPRVDLLTGRLSGLVWSANCGWISLSNSVAHVQTDSLSCPDTDGDGIADAWEHLHFGNLASANGATDADGDGVSDLAESVADTNPTDPSSYLRIVAWDRAGFFDWPSSLTRFYRVQETPTLNPGFTWVNAGAGLIQPTGPTTRFNFITNANPERYFRVEAVRPLKP